MTASTDSLLIAGSIATDHLMTFGGRFADSLVADQLEKLSVSFLVDELHFRRGGVAANISFGLASLGFSPVLVGAVGKDFADYRTWLESHGVNCGHIRVSDTQHTARFTSTSDSVMSQIANFYPGAMSESREIELEPIVAAVGAPRYVLIAPDDPEGMRRHTEECRERSYPFIADPSQQLAVADGELIRALIDGAAILFSNEYESHLIAEKTGWSGEEVLDRVGLHVTTLGADGARIARAGEEPIEVPVAIRVAPTEPTGVGDAFRAGFLAATVWGIDVTGAAQVGSALASFKLEVVGPQEYSFTDEQLVARLREAYNDQIAAAVAEQITGLTPPLRHAS